MAILYNSYIALKHNAIQSNAPIKLLNQNDTSGNHIINQQDGHYLQQHKQFTNQSNIFNNPGAYQQRLQANHIQTDTQFNPTYPKQSEINTYPQQQQGLANQIIVQSEQKMLIDHINKYNNVDLQKNLNQHGSSIANGKQQQSRTNSNNNNSNDQEFLPEFTASKSDPKYQTLPYNTKFSTSNNVNSNNGKTNNKVQFYDDANKQTNDVLTSSGIVKTSSSSNVNNILSTVGGNVNHMTAHSAPFTIGNKGHATALSNDNETNSGYHIQKSESSGKCNQEEKENLHANVRENQQPKVVGEQYKVSGFGGGRAELVRGFSRHATVTSTSTGQIVKPVSSVAPTTVQVAGGRPSPIYRTSSTKIQPVQPQTVSNSLSNNNALNSIIHSFQNQNKQGGALPLQNASVSSLLMSPPQSSSTPMSTPDVTSDKSVPKPALPPKPAPKVSASDVSSDSKTSETSSEQTEQESSNQNTPQSNSSAENQQMIIKARPLTIRKQPLSEQPKLRNQSNNALKNNGVNIATTRRIEMPSAFLFADMEQQQRESSPQTERSSDAKNNGSKLQHSGTNNSCLNSDVVDRAIVSSESSETSSEDQSDKNGVSNLADQMNMVEINNSNNGETISRRVKKGNLKQGGKVNLSRRVSFDPLALLLDASLEGELELVKKTATQVANPSAANDEGITALHNAICAGHFEIVKFLVEFGCDVNAQDSDGWTPLHCAASCNNVAMVRFLVENGACIFATTLSDHETAAQKCEEDEEGFDGCSEYLYSVQEKLGIMNSGTVYAVFPYSAHENDELSFNAGSRLSVLRKGDESEREWWWVQDQCAREGYVPRNLLGLYPRISPQQELQE